MSGPSSPSAVDERALPRDEAVAAPPSEARCWHVLLAGALVAALCEGAQAVGAALGSAGGSGGSGGSGGEAGLATAPLVFWLSSGTVLAPLVLVALPLGYLLDRACFRSFARDLRTALTGDAGRTTSALSVFAALLSVGGSAVAATLVGRVVKERVSANVTVTITVVTELAVLVALVLGTGLAARAFASWLRARATGRAAAVFLAGGLGPALGVALLAIATLAVLLPRPFLVTIGGGACALALASVDVGRRALASVLRGARGRYVGLGALLVGLSAPASIDHLPRAAGRLVLYRSPLAGAILVAARSLVDRDHDGFSPILLGGDCDDHDPNVHPGAVDVPNNGIDENCSGADATGFASVHQAPVSRPPGLAPRLNVVMILIDALRPDHLSFAGYARPTSPNLDRFRETATWFENAYTAAPSTRFALSTVFTGREVEAMPQRRGPGIDFELLPGARTIASRLGELGYARMGFTDSYVVQHIRGVGAGFTRWETPWPVDDWQASYAVSATKTTAAALGWLARTKESAPNPYLLFLHYRCTHDPYGKDPRWRYGDAPVDDYDSALNFCDDEIGRLLTALDARQDRDRTAVVMFSDHGELFGEHGFTNHGNTLSEPDVRTLLMMRVPGLAQVRTVRTPVSLVDLEPTTLMLAGAPADAETRAWNLLPLLTRGDDAGDPARPLYLYLDLTRGTVRHEGRGVVRGHFKLVRDLSSGSTELFDVAADPGERVDVAASQPRERAELGEALEAWERDAARLPPSR